MKNHHVSVSIASKEIKSLEQYARGYRVTPSELIHEYAGRLLQKKRFAIDPRVKRMIGILPRGGEVRKEYHEYLLRKHT